MVKNIYHHAMKDHIENWLGAITGLGGGGFAVTMLSINLQTIEGLIYFLLSSFFAGLFGYMAKKIGELLWNKITKPKKLKDEKVHSGDASREWDGNFE